MTASSDSQRLASSSLEEARLFEMLEQPEHWPEDPALQAELAGLLELHLALGSHSPALSEALVPTPRVRWTTSWSLAAAAILLVALVPAAYTVKHIQTLRTQAQDTVRLEHLARKRTQDRAWIAFFQQSTTLLQDFEQNPAL